MFRYKFYTSPEHFTPSRMVWPLQKKFLTAKKTLQKNVGTAEKRRKNWTPPHKILRQTKNIYKKKGFPH